MLYEKNRKRSTHKIFEVSYEDIGYGQGEIIHPISLELVLDQSSCVPITVYTAHHYHPQ